MYRFVICVIFPFPSFFIFLNLKIETFFELIFNSSTLCLKAVGLHHYRKCDGFAEKDGLKKKISAWWLGFFLSLLKMSKAPTPKESTQPQNVSHFYSAFSDSQLCPAFWRELCAVFGDWETGRAVGAGRGETVDKGDHRYLGPVAVCSKSKTNSQTSLYRRHDKPAPYRYHTSEMT